MKKSVNPVVAVVVIVIIVVVIVAIFMMAGKSKTQQSLDATPEGAGGKGMMGEKMKSKMGTMMQGSGATTDSGGPPAPALP